MNSEEIGQLLIEASQNIVLKNMENWLKEKHPNVRIRFRLGSGAKTYHRKKRLNDHIIVYGKKMIESKMISQKQCGMWRCSKEITERNYFNGEFSIQESLVATVLHEVAHFIQTLNNERTKRSVHNEYFYKVLDRMHLSGVGYEVLNYLNKNERFKNLSYQNNEDYSETIFNKEDFNTNDVVYFYNQNKELKHDVVLSKGSKKLKCTTYSVPYSLIIKKDTNIENLDPKIANRIPKYSKKDIKKDDIVHFKNRRYIDSDIVIKSNPTNVVTKRGYKIPYQVIVNVDSI